MNPTIERFGFPATLLREYKHWIVLLRPSQITLGSMVLAAKSDATAYSQLPDAAFAEQAVAVREIETSLAAFCQYERINYLMLMMVDPNVHFHVIPRYSTPRKWREIQFVDDGWPGPPNLAAAPQLSSQDLAELACDLAARFC